MFDISRIAAISPDLRTADTRFNADVLSGEYRNAVNNGASLVLFPAMAITGKSCGSLFFLPGLLNAAESAAGSFAAATGSVPAVFGMPKLVGGKVLECAAIAQNGKIIAYIVRSNPDIPGFSGIVPQGENFHPAGTVFDGGLRFAINFDGDIPVFPQAHLLLILGADKEVPGSFRQRETRCLAASMQISGAVAAAFAGCGESTTDHMYGGSLIICDRGKLLASRPSPAMHSANICADIDREVITAAQMKTPFAQAENIPVSTVPDAPDFRFLHNPAHPFLPDDPQELDNFCRETFALQSIGLAQRFKRCFAQKMVLGISGGLDSTLALIVLAMVCRENNLPPDTIIAVTMPGFGTTGRTRNNATRLAEVIGAEIREIPIAEACSMHFRDIGHDPNVTNSVYENSQARERTQILMDIANSCNGIVIGTGDLSEIALGWSTFNGDQMAMYSVNSSIPKSNIAAMLHYAAEVIPNTREILMDVINTPVSPELLPLDENGEITQKTENILGAYEIHDFYLFNFMQGISKPEKLFALAQNAFSGKYPSEELERVRELFFKRFFSQQFKRTAAPDGIQAGIISLSARSSWQMGSDISYFFSREKK